jgi:hypothetical protein
VIERALIDYFRCPEQLVKMALAGELSTDSGFFLFDSSVCYGQTSCGTRSPVSTAQLCDVAPAITSEAGVLQVPFDPSQVVDNLRLEHYASDSRSVDARCQTPWQRLYYSVRRFMPATVRRTLQRTYFRDFKTPRFPRWPVDDTVDQVLERLLLLSLRSRGITRMPFIWFWPDGAPSCAIMTHDVETSVGRDRCSWLMDVNDSYGIKAAFQIVPEERYSVSPAFLEEIRVRGFEINLHDLNHDGRLFRDRDEFRRRAHRINQYARAFGARGFRSGQLYRHPDWYEALEVAYDMSVPNAAHLEVQRGGCCTVMPYFIGDIVELPLTTTQDYSLFYILRDFSNEVWKTQIESIIGRHGLLSFVIHPDYLGDDTAQRAYRTLLDSLARLRDAERCWLPFPGAVEHWWRQRSHLMLVPDGTRWRIEGPGKERARVAYAELHGNELKYLIEPASPDGNGTTTA